MLCFALKKSFTICMNFILRYFIDTIQPHTADDVPPRATAISPNGVEKSTVIPQRLSMDTAMHTIIICPSVPDRYRARALFRVILLPAYF